MVILDVHRLWENEQLQISIQNVFELVSCLLGLGCDRSVTYKDGDYNSSKSRSTYRLIKLQNVCDCETGLQSFRFYFRPTVHIDHINRLILKNV